MFTQYSHLCSATRNAAVTCTAYVACPLCVKTIRIGKRQMLVSELALLLFQKSVGHMCLNNCGLHCTAHACIETRNLCSAKFSHLKKNDVTFMLTWYMSWEMKQNQDHNVCRTQHSNYSSKPRQKKSRSLFFMDVTKRLLVVSYRRFGITCRSHLQWSSSRNAWLLKKGPERLSRNV